MNLVETYVPGWVVRAAANRDMDSTGPVGERFVAVAMIADVSGFTALGEHLAAGRDGAELLWRLVNAYFGRMLEHIGAHGGDVLRFAGDAPIVIWRVEPRDDPNEVAHRAAHCALELQRLLGVYLTEQGHELRMRVGLGVGEVIAARVGGVRGRWECVVAGPPFAQMSASLDQSEVGEVVVSAEMVAMLVSKAKVEPLNGVFRLKRISGIDPRASPPPAVGDKIRKWLSAFIPGGVVGRISAGQSEWLGELRNVSALFVGIDGLEFAEDEVLHSLDDLVQRLQAGVYQFDGTVNQFLMDDKGLVLVAAWGLPSCTYEDDAVRAVRAATTILQAVQDLGLSARVGVSTGRAFCGVKGNQARAEYGLLGASVNRAARLMTRSNGEVLCCAMTEQAARSRIQFDRLDDAQLKGGAAAVKVFRPRRSREAPAGRAEATLFGRKPEVAELENALDNLAAGRGGLLVLEGDAGIGKSVLMDHAARLAEAKGISVRAGNADAIEARMPYHAFTGVFASILGLSVDTRTEGLGPALADLGLAELAPLFNPVLRLNQPDNEVTADLDSEGRGARTIHTYLEVLRSASSLFVTLDDLQWMDSASWELLRLALRDLPDALFIVGTRSPGLPVSSERQALLETPGAIHRILKPLAADDVEALVCARLGAQSLPAEVSEVIAQRAEGHPFYSEELAVAMLDAEMIGVEDGVCVVAAEAGDLKHASLPSTLEGLIASRLDRLTPVGQLGLKTASVIGRVFAVRMLRDIFPVADGKAELGPEMEKIRSLGLTQIEHPEPDLSYLFRQAITQEVAYEQLLFEQRRQLHHAVAEWFEAGNAGELAPLYPLLAYHWQKAEVRDRAVDSLEAAAELSFRAFANAEAVAFLTSAKALEESAEPARRARWERVLGEAQSRMGHMDVAVAHLKRCCELLGEPVPNSKIGLGLKLTVECLRQIWRRYFGAPTPSDLDRERRLDAANAFMELGSVAYHGGDVLMLLYGTVRGLNLAEDVGSSPDLARFKASMGIVVASLPGMHDTAERYSVEALDMAAQFDDVYSLANARHYRGAYLCGMGRWDDAQTPILSACDGYERVGNGRRWSEAQQCLIHIRMNQGRCADADTHLDELFSSVRHREDKQGTFWAQLIRVENLWRVGCVSEALEVLARVDLADQADEIFIDRMHGLRVHLALDQGDLEHATLCAEPLLPQKRAASFVQIWAYTCVPELMLAQWRRDGPGEGRAKTAAKACKMLVSFSATFPLALPSAKLYQGQCLELEGRAEDARTTWEASLEAATRMNMQWDRARAFEALAGLGGPGAEDHLNSARVIRDAMRSASERTTQSA